MSASLPTAGLPVRRAGWLRMPVELTVSLVVLVLLFRTFLAGGYLIETGSMAPCLLGSHWRVECPSCRFRFAVEGKRSAGKTICPNCGKTGLSVDAHPRSDGDQLLVNRTAFALRPPRRWEVVAFRNPQKPTQAYVKRLAGLPGETIELRDGDLFVDGAIQAKAYATQCGMRVLVYDHDCRPDDADGDWQPRWVAETTDGGWSSDGTTFTFEARTGGAAPAQPEWLSYRHWVRQGGRHDTQVALAEWAAVSPAPTSGVDPLVYDMAARELVCQGAMPRALYERLLQESTDATFRTAIERLYEASHVAPITDICGYNRGGERGGECEVRDLMISARVTLGDRAGEFLIELTDGVETMRCEFDTQRHEVRLRDVRTGKAVRTAALPETLSNRGALLDFSLMDRQALLAVDGRVLFEPWSYPAPADRGTTPRRPVRIGARGVPVHVESIRLYRDVHYRAAAGSSADSARFVLGPDEYFVLGDNSPVSRDSRTWPRQTALRADMFLGKPIVSHLPSRRERVHLGNRELEIRIPEPSRIRYIH